MNTKEILRDLGARTNGDIYLGVVGPVRTGKSTFIRRFMELAVIPNITDEYAKSRTIDELPQAGQGRQIMTTEPKFVPNTAASIQIDEKLSVKIRLVDCVGYVIKEAKGYQEENGARMVKTPWFEEPIPFDEAAKIGTQKVIQDHSTIGIVITSDGTIGDIPRESFLQAEKDVIEELKRLQKPFIVIVNSTNPQGEKALQTVDYIQKTYQVTAIPLSVDQMSVDQIVQILKEALNEFPVVQIDISLPRWVAVLNEDHWLKQSLKENVSQSMQRAQKIRDVQLIGGVMKENPYVTEYELANVDTSTGKVNVQIGIQEKLYDQIVQEIVGKDIEDKSELLAILQDYSNTKKSYEGIKDAYQMALQANYGIGTPRIENIQIDRPILVKQSGRYGIKIKAHVPAFHLIKVDIETSFEPIIGSKEQSEQLIASLVEDYDKNPQLMLDNQLFGRKLGDVIQDGVLAKLNTIPEPTRIKLQSLLRTMTNKGKNNIIAIVF